jgi:hypothetical protein
MELEEVKVVTKRTYKHSPEMAKSMAFSKQVKDLQRMVRQYGLLKTRLGKMEAQIRKAKKVLVSQIA